MSWSTEVNEYQNHNLQQHYMDSPLAQQTPQIKMMENYRKNSNKLHNFMNVTEYV